MKVGRYISLLCTAIAVVAVAGCVRAPQTGQRTITYVENLLTDSVSVSGSLLNSYEVTSKGSIVIIGPLERCFHLSETFMKHDMFDNVDGSKTPDSLPDFAGETVVSIMDVANAPYEPYVTAGNQDFLREIAVRNTLLAIQGGTNNPKVTKTPAKVIIFASGIVNEYGLFDVDTLSRATGKNIPVLVAPDESSDSLVVADCFKLLRQRNLFTHKVAYPASEIYVTTPASGLPSSAYAYGSTDLFSDSYKYSRVPNAGIDTYVLVPFSDRYLMEEDEEPLE